MIVIRSLTAAVLAVTFSFAATSAFATGITIINPGFESDAPFETTDPINDPWYTGWEVYYPDDPDSGQFFGVFVPDGTIYNQLAPEGDKVGYFDLASGGGSPCFTCDPTDGTYPVGLQQTLTATLEANKRYDLSVAVGNPKSGGGFNYTGFGGYKVQLVAGTTVIAEDNNSNSIAEGEFETSSLSFVTGSSPPLFLQALGIRLIHKNALDKPDPITEPPLWFSGIAFDDVQLSVSAVPVPAAVWLFGTALIGLFGFGKRRKTA